MDTKRVFDDFVAVLAEIFYNVLDISLIPLYNIHILFITKRWDVQK